MNPILQWLNAQPWLRPVTAVVTGVCLFVQQYDHNPSHLAIVGKVLAVALTLGAGSFGQSNSGLGPTAGTLKVVK